MKIVHMLAVFVWQVLCTYSSVQCEKCNDESPFVEIFFTQYNVQGTTNLIILNFKTNIFICQL